MSPRLISTFLDAKAAEAGAAENTLLAYARDLSHFYEWADGRDILTLTMVDIEGYLIELDQSGMAKSTRARRLSALKQFYRFAVEEGWRDDNPAIQINGPGKSKKLPQTLSMEDVDALLHAAMNMGKNRNDLWRDTCLMQLLYATGMRVSEMMSLPLSAARGNPAMLLISGKGGKERIVPLSRPAKDAFHTWVRLRDEEDALLRTNGKPTSGFLFPSRGKLGHLTRHWFYARIKELALYANIDVSRVTPHTIRHAFATHLLANGADLRIIQTLLGHADVSTTEIYTHVLSERLESLVQDHHPLARPRKSRGKTSSEGQ